MNEQLIDIAMKANDQTGNEFDLNYKPLDVFLEKFAELIVKECCKSCTLQADEDHMFRKFGIKHHGVEQ